MKAVDQMRNLIVGPDAVFWGEVQEIIDDLCDPNKRWPRNLTLRRTAIESLVQFSIDHGRRTTSAQSPKEKP